MVRRRGIVAVSWLRLGKLLIAAGSGRLLLAGAAVTSQQAHAGLLGRTAHLDRLVPGLGLDYDRWYVGKLAMSPPALAVRCHSRSQTICPSPPMTTRSPMNISTRHAGSPDKPTPAGLAVPRRTTVTTLAGRTRRGAQPPPGTMCASIPPQRKSLTV